MSVFSLLNRRRNLVDIAIPMQDGVVSYKVYISNSLADAYNPATIVVLTANGSDLVVKSGSVFRSPSLVRKKQEMQMGSNRGITRVIFDPMDYYDPTAKVPTDDQQMYVRIRGINSLGTVLNFSGILVVPPPNFYKFPSGAMTMIHNAVPNLDSKVVGDLPSIKDLHIIVPSFVNFFRIHCSAVGPNNQDLLYSPNAGMPYIRVKNNDDLSIFGNANNEFFFVSDDSSNTSKLDLFLTCSLDPI